MPLFHTSMNSTLYFQSKHFDSVFKRTKDSVHLVLEKILGMRLKDEKWTHNKKTNSHFSRS